MKTAGAVFLVGCAVAIGNAQSPSLNPSGSLYSADDYMGDLFRDPRASNVGDLLTVVVSDRASAVSRGSMTSSRAASARYGIGALGGPVHEGGRLGDLARLGGERDLQGEGSTTRENVLSTTLSVTVVKRYPNGTMLIEGEKRVTVNADVQVVRLQALARREDVLPGNMIRSERLANLEVTVNGKGVIGDAIKRPFILYRLLLGLLPF